LLLIGQGFQNIMYSYFWYLPFASVRQCKYVMDRAKIPEDEWRTKREDLADERKMTVTGARESLKAGLKAWLASDFYAQRRGKLVSLPKSTTGKSIVVDDDA
jgi:hypothetical protein